MSSGIVSGTPSHEALSTACQSADGSSSIELKVLGPVELAVDGRVTSVRSSRTRRLLAMLALYRDRVVSTDRLVDAVWGEALPGNPAAALQSQVSRVRASLGPAGAGIETTSGGYRLSTDVIAVDVVRFESTLAAARAESSAERRAELLGEAVAMVRGAAFEDLDVDGADIDARRIADLAAAAREELVATGPVRKPSVRRVPAPAADVMGRDDDLAAVAKLLSTARIVTLTGPGGVGKTTLALAAADRHRRGTGSVNAFVDLAAVTAAQDVPAAFARALGAERVGGQEWADRLVEAAAGEPLLLVVDNAEHVVDATAALVADLAARTHAVVLTTSRVRLGLPGEHLWVVEPLDALGAAVDLFERRARAVRPGWSTSGDDSASVNEICRRVDGLPLAVELAAAQLRWRSPSEIAASLGRPLEALERVFPGRGRHSGLRAVIEDSYLLLDADQQSHLAHLGVFAAGFTAASAAQVLVGEGTDVGTAGRHIGALVEHSLVRATPASAGTRYSVLDAVRHYALERLEQDGLVADARSRHATAMVELTERAARVMWSSDEPAWVLRLNDERADICAAHRWLVDRGEREGALRLATAAYWVAWPRGWSDLRRLIDATVLDDGTATPDALGPALGVAADLALHDGDADRAATLARRSLSVSGGRPGLDMAGGVLGDVALFGGDTEGAVEGWRAAAEAWRLTLPGLEPWATGATALALTYSGHVKDAVAVAAEAQEAADRHGCATARAFARYAAAEACAPSDPDRAVALLGDSIAIASTASVALVANLARLALATLAARQGNSAAAVAHYPVILQEWRRTGQWVQQWNTLRTLVPILVQVGARPEAATILGGLRANARAATWGADAEGLDYAESLLGQALGDGYARHLEQGATLSPVDLVLFAERSAARYGKT